MPTVINQFGCMVRVSEDTRQRMADSGQIRDAEEMDFKSHQPDDWVLPYAPARDHGEQIPLHREGDRPIVIRGRGPSQGDAKRVVGGYVIAVNPHPGSDEADAVAAIDRPYWSKPTHPLKAQQWGGPWYEPWKRTCMTHEIFTVGACKYDAPAGAWITPKMLMPGHTPERPRVGIAVLDKGLVYSANYTAVWCTLIARWLSRGPIVLAGIDLSSGIYGTRAAPKGQPRRVRNGTVMISQAQAWLRVASVLKGQVYRVPSMTGPLDGLPVWEGMADE